MGKKISKTDGANQAEIVAELSEKVMQHDGLLADIKKDISEMKNLGRMAGKRNSTAPTDPAESAEPKTYFLQLKAEDRDLFVKKVSALIEEKYDERLKGLQNEINETKGKVEKKADKDEIEKLRSEKSAKILEASNQHEQKNTAIEPSRNPKSLLIEIWELLKDSVILILRTIWLLLKSIWAILRAIYKCGCAVYNSLMNEKLWNWIYDHGTFLLSIIVFAGLAWFMWYSYGNIFK